MRLLDVLIFSIGELLTIMSCLLISITLFELKIKIKKSVGLLYLIFVLACFIVFKTILLICFGFIFEFFAFSMIVNALLPRKVLIFIIVAFSETLVNIAIHVLIPIDATLFGDGKILFTKIVTVVVFFFIYLISFKIKYRRKKLDYIPYYSYLNLIISISFILIPLVIFNFFGKSMNFFAFNIIFIPVCLAFMSNITLFLQHNNKLLENSEYKLQISYKEQLLVLQKKYTEDLVTWSTR